MEFTIEIKNVIFEISEMKMAVSTNSIIKSILSVIPTLKLNSFLKTGFALYGRARQPSDCPSFQCVYIIMRYAALLFVVDVFYHDCAAGHR